VSVYFFLVIQQMIAGGSHIVGKAVLRDIDASSLTLFRSILSAVPMLIILAARRNHWRVAREDYSKLLWLSFLAVPVNQFIYLYGLSFTSPSNSALLYATTPVVVLVLSRLFLGERISWKKIFGMSLALGGVTSVIFEHGFALNSSATYGNLVLAVGVLCWAYMTIYAKPLIEKYGPLYISAVTLVIGMVLYLPIGMSLGKPMSFTSLSAGDWAGLTYFAVATSIISHFLWYFALGRIEASKVAVFTNGQPFFATLLAVFFLSQDLSVTFVVGGLVTVCGVVLVQLG